MHDGGCSAGQRLGERLRIAGALDFLQVAVVLNVWSVMDEMTNLDAAGKACGLSSNSRVKSILPCNTNKILTPRVESAWGCAIDVSHHEIKADMTIKSEQIRVRNRELWLHLDTPLREWTSIKNKNGLVGTKTTRLSHSAPAG